MTTLYVANCSKQHHQFNYRIPELGVRKEDIPAGGQKQIGGEMASDTVDYILSQHRPYGLIAAEDAGKHKGFAGLCFSVGKPVKLKDIQLRFEKNEEALVERGEEIREETAASIASSLDQNAGPLNHLEVEIVEQTKPGQTPKVATGVEISKDDKSRHGATRSKRSPRKK